ncbi:phosphoribosylaminoimidazolesuccinocarboxamide synthase [Actinoplanes subglobosus]|uniref:Phosphoribosylaminoimidazole-succinocarboxamide synthase n=1 Tax=Actinoplanes subglobosus TaxID=1547892 RepID=A0ABV8IRE0_9ACTN
MREPRMNLIHSGKVRDVYEDGGDILLVASDRVSVYDVILPTPIPDKGKILTQLSLWWFEQLADIVPNHVVSATDVPSEWAGRAVRCRRLEMAQVECIARGYLAGLGLKEYQRDQAVSGVSLPTGLVEGSKLPEPIFTPTTKAQVGHDEFMTYEEVVAQYDPGVADELRRITLEVYSRGEQIAREKGVIIFDTKLELGWTRDGKLVLGDEVFTPDSSRFVAVEDWKPGEEQRYMDKQFVRNWSSGLADWDRTPPGPAIPDDVVDATRARYVEAYERITGKAWV